MGHIRLNKLKPILKSIFLVGVIAILFFSQADGALAPAVGDGWEDLSALPVALIVHPAVPTPPIEAMVAVASAFPS